MDTFGKFWNILGYFLFQHLVTLVGRNIQLLNIGVVQVPVSKAFTIGATPDSIPHGNKELFMSKKQNVRTEQRNQARSKCRQKQF